ncbi:MAG: phosphatase PAP2 family protein [Lachnospiraceae bacterium]|nr:phosphatase PAP2 family protein [Lachnospiraceae bacterium]
MKRLWDKIKAIPRYGWILAFVYFGLQYGMYRLGDFLSRVLGTIDRAWECKVPFIDDRIPLIPVFVIIYLFSYVFWICGPLAVSLTKKAHFKNYIIGLSLAYIVGFLFFVFLPTYMDRAKEGLMGFADKPGLLNGLLAMVYGADGGTLAFNLFPSYHCLISMYCYLGVRKQPEISKGFKIYSLVMAILISLSTVFTKQHYFLDVPSGIGISLLCYWLVNKWDPGKEFANSRR